MPPLIARSDSSGQSYVNAGPIGQPGMGPQPVITGGGEPTQRVLPAANPGP